MFLLCFCHACVRRYSLGVTQEEMNQELHDYLPSLEHWAKEYLNSQTPKAISLKMYVCIHTHTNVISNAGINLMMLSVKLTIV